MKEVGRERNKASGRNAVERERTKMRERQRRSITTNIFHGLRKHGGYRLSPRADINEVLRHLAQEAGWTVQHDGTTFRSATSTGAVSCPVCGGGIKSTPDSAVKNLSSSGLVPQEETPLSVYMSAARASEAGGGSGSTVYGEGQQQ